MARMFRLTFNEDEFYELHRVFNAAKIPVPNAQLAVQINARLNDPDILTDDGKEGSSGAFVPSEPQGDEAMPPMMGDQ